MSAEKKLHWTQRPENKEKVHKMGLVAARTRKRQREHKTHQSPPVIHVETIPQDTFAYALGYIECWIEHYAKSASLSGETLAAQLGKVLSVKSRR